MLALGLNLLRIVSSSMLDGDCRIADSAARPSISNVIKLSRIWPTISMFTTLPLTKRWRCLHLDTTTILRAVLRSPYAVEARRSVSSLQFLHNPHHDLQALWFSASKNAKRDLLARTYDFGSRSAIFSYGLYSCCSSRKCYFKMIRQKQTKKHLNRR